MHQQNFKIPKTRNYIPFQTFLFSQNFINLSFIPDSKITQRHFSLQYLQVLKSALLNP